MHVFIILWFLSLSSNICNRLKRKKRAFVGPYFFETHFETILCVTKWQQKKKAHVKWNSVLGIQAHSIYFVLSALLANRNVLSFLLFSKRHLTQYLMNGVRYPEYNRCVLEKKWKAKLKNFIFKKISYMKILWYFI